MKKYIQSPENKLIAGLLLFLVLIIASRFLISSLSRDSERFEWRARAETSNEFPIMFSNCSFEHTGYPNVGDYENINALLLGEGSDRYVSCGGADLGEGLYPNIVHLSYYSFEEEKFYGGTFNLNYDSITSIAATMRKAVNTTGSHFTKEITFKATVHPKGTIVVSMESWIDTPIGEVIIANFKAQPEEHDWSVFKYHNNFSRVSESTSVALQQTLLHKKHNWQVEVLLPDGSSITDFDVYLFANRPYKMELIKNTEMPTYGNFGYLPYSLNLAWKPEDKDEFSMRFEFDEEELIQAFETDDTLDSTKPIMMQVIVNEDHSEVTAIVNRNGKTIELTNQGSGTIYD